MGMFVRWSSIVYSSVAWTLYWYHFLGFAEFVLYGRIYELRSLIVIVFVGSFWAYLNGYDTNIYLIDKIKEYRAARKEKT